VLFSGVGLASGAANSQRQSPAGERVLTSVSGMSSDEDDRCGDSLLDAAVAPLGHTSPTVIPQILNANERGSIPTENRPLSGCTSVVKTGSSESPAGTPTSTPKRLRRSAVPRPLDVLLGRGRGRQKHPGNKRMMEIIAMHKARYFSEATDKESKTAAIRDIIAAIQDCEDGGRFLQEVPCKNKWVEVDEYVAHARVSQCIRYKHRDDEDHQVDSGTYAKMTERTKILPDGMMAQGKRLVDHQDKISSGASTSQGIQHASPLLKRTADQHVQQNYHSSASSTSTGDVRPNRETNRSGTQSPASVVGHSPVFNRSQDMGHRQHMLQQRYQLGLPSPIHTSYQLTSPFRPLSTAAEYDASALRPQQQHTILSSKQAPADQAGASDRLDTVSQTTSCLAATHSKEGRLTPALEGANYESSPIDDIDSIFVD
jgi:hypothetical protein